MTLDEPAIAAVDYDFRLLDELDIRILALWHSAFGRRAPYLPDRFEQRQDIKDHYLRFLEFHQRQGVPL